MTQELIKFILEARRRGLGNAKIREALLGNGWPLNIVEKAFAELEPGYRAKNKVCIYLDSEIMARLEKRAKTNMLTLSEQIEDILRRSALIPKKSGEKEKLDDLLVSLFSRKKR
ncbi:hypothetical protein CO038_04505 [Candidatus Pacearchaeota archaeon CG_4_9_14_0_2_um_filter_39_13]|nr:hypothetical protein [Candidatus Pacearchaeota archaeon]OIO42580.1 MAG: hypothetical protein AUJ64_03805 [Candidatus Pacearchaeota archaeon CG1_02_39_14]PJC44330.1 MAG: hypothetical protein CO038_04505 [Candidatus Pacearchaeota archaeon CG_4_9_14_0_2_um_filter_39_13]